jgi:hypothetical protein
MLSAAALVSDGRLDPVAIDAAAPDMAAWTAAWDAAQGAKQPAELAALAIIAGRQKLAVAPVLVPLLGRDGVAGRAGAWALGQLDGEAALLDAVIHGGFDQRENGFWGLAVLAARGAAGAGLGAALEARVGAELERAKKGGTSMAEHACRVLAVLGSPGLPALIQQVIEQDRFCDRFELQRQRKAVEDNRRDVQTVRELTAPWETLFTEHVKEEPKAPAPAVPAAPAPAGKVIGSKPAPAAKGPAGPVARGPAAPPAPPRGPTGPAGRPPPPPPSRAMPPPPVEEDIADEDMGALPPEAGMGAEGVDDANAPKPVDWKEFLASPEAAALAPQSKALVAQIGPVLEQIAAQAIQAMLADLHGQEFAALLIQVLPQAFAKQPQAIQAALSPHALNGYQALARWLVRTGASAPDSDLVEGVKLVRKTLQQQMRASGMLGGPDYSDPDDAPAPAPKPAPPAAP